MLKFLSNYSETIYFWISISVLFLVVYISKRNKLVRKVLEFIQNSITTFICSCSLVSALTIASYYISVMLGLVDLNPENQQASKEVELFIIMALCLITGLAFNPTSLIIRGYMQRYDEQWKIYENHYLYTVTLAMMSVSSIMLLRFEHINLEFPNWAKEYIKIVIQSKIIIMAFFLHCFCLLLSAKSIRKKYLESNPFLK